MSQQRRLFAQDGAQRPGKIHPQEAQEIHQAALSSSTEYVNLPEHLHPAAQRVFLWENPSYNNLPA